MILRILPLLLLLTVLPVGFIYITRLRGLKSKRRGLLLLVPNAILLILTVFFACNNDMLLRYQEFVAVYLVVLYSITVPEVFYAIFSGLSRISRRVRVRRIGHIAGLIAAGVVFVAFGVAVVSCFTVLRVQRHVYVSKDLPETFNGYKIVHISDLHLGTFGFYPKALRRITTAVNAENADLVAFTGDLVNFDRREIVPFREELARIKARDGVVSVMGNHDYQMYVSQKGCGENAKRVAELQKEQRLAGWRLLLNENMVIRRAKDSIVVIGSENDGTKSFPSRGDLEVATRGIGKGAFKVLLSHDPTQWQQKVLPLTDIQLTLSGHTHAGQFKLFGHSVSELAYKECDGMYFCGTRALLVSSGLGEALMPFRLGAWPTIDVVILKRDKLK